MFEDEASRILAACMRSDAMLGVGVGSSLRVLVQPPSPSERLQPEIISRQRHTMGLV